ncbi:MAG: DUF2314 domain-containing protein [Planctomycetota bacterium]
MTMSNVVSERVRKTNAFVPAHSDLLFEGKRKQLENMSDDNLIPFFVPALGAVLIAAEDKKGEPLTEEEVLEIRDSAVCMMVPPENVAKLSESRGYKDLDPENCWYDWQMLRRELDRKPDLDPGARVDMVQGSDPAYQACVSKAQATLQDFRDMLQEYDPYSCLIKTRVEDGEQHGYIWLFNTRRIEIGFQATVFELPAFAPNLEIGQELEIAESEVVDWMINDEGTLYGGFSLRYHRQQLPPEERPAFDEHIGVTNYA